MEMNPKPSNSKPPVMFVPGGVMPVEMSYGALLSVLKDQVQPITKELEVYAGDNPPPDYGMEMEVEGIRREADAAGVQRFHLVGYSAGGAFSLAFAAKYPERLLSLALIEPAWIGSLTQADAEDWAAQGRVMALPPEERMQAFMRWQMRPGVEPPVFKIPEPPPAWMAKRPGGLVTISRAFNAYSYDINRFRQFRHPVYFAFGSLSTRLYERQAKRLGSVFPNLQVEEYAGRSHFDPPHRAEAERFARALQGLWARAEVAEMAG
jgi:pimeloyl-ACP methyl ester carboxylesterase